MKVYTPELTSNESTELIEKANRKLYETIMKKRDKFILTYKRIPRYVIVSYDTMYALEAYFNTRTDNAHLQACRFSNLRGSLGLKAQRYIE